METKNFKVLLVDDDEINQLVACTFLKKWNVDVVVARDGHQALDLIASKTFHLVMMDLHMPGMDGTECTRQIRSKNDPYFKNIPIILFSASVTYDTQKAARELGMSDIMSKPFHQDELKAKISAYLPLNFAASRPLHIDFDTHAADDPVFKNELLNLLTEHLRELSRSLEMALAKRKKEDFRKMAHKVATVFVILNDPELTEVFERLKSLIVAGEWQSTVLKTSVADFERICSEVIAAMEDEMRSTRNGDLTH